jgi:hypothetical protein
MAVLYSILAWIVFDCNLIRVFERMENWACSFPCTTCWPTYGLPWLPHPTQVRSILLTWVGSRLIEFIDWLGGSDFLIHSTISATNQQANWTSISITTHTGLKKTTTHWIGNFWRRNAQQPVEKERKTSLCTKNLIHDVIKLTLTFLAVDRHISIQISLNFRAN